MDFTMDRGLLKSYVNEKHWADCADTLHTAHSLTAMVSGM